MTPQEDREQLIGRARQALGVGPAELDEAARRFAARIEVESARGGWRSAPEFAPMLRTWGRVLVLGAIGVGLVAVSMAKCPLYEHSVAQPVDHGVGDDDE